MEQREGSSSPKRQKLEPSKLSDQDSFIISKLLKPYLRVGGVIHSTLDVSSLSLPFLGPDVKTADFRDAPVLNFRLICKKWNRRLRHEFEACLDSILQWKLDTLVSGQLTPKISLTFESSLNWISLSKEEPGTPLSRLFDSIISTYRKANETGMAVHLPETLILGAIHLFHHKDNLHWIVTRPEFNKAHSTRRVVFIQMLVRMTGGTHLDAGDPRSLLNGTAARLLDDARLPKVSFFSLGEIREAFNSATDFNAWIFYYIFSRDHPDFWSDFNFQARILTRARFDSIEDLRERLFHKFYKKTANKVQFLDTLQRAAERRPIMNQAFLRDIALLRRPPELVAQPPLQLLSSFSPSESRDWWRSIFRGSKDDPG